MLSSLATKTAIRKVGLPGDALDFSSWTGFNNSSGSKTSIKTSKFFP
jgi:hypothetical protein